MRLRGRTVVLYGTFRSVRRREAVRLLEALGARVAKTVTERTDLIFCADGSPGPLPRTEKTHRTPYYDEEALLGMVGLDRRGNADAPAAEEPPPFLSARALAEAAGPDALRGLLDGADWSAFTPDRDLPPLRDRLLELERAEGVTEAHRLADRRVRASGEARLVHPYGHDAEIVGHALSPDGRYLATGSWVTQEYAEGGVLQIWEVAAGRCVNTVRRIDGGIGWPEYKGTIQWSADSTRLAITHSTNRVGVWEPTAGSSAPIATVDVSGGDSRPSDFALSPDGREIYLHCGTNGDGGLQGCLLPLDRGTLRWLPHRVTGDHPYLLSRSLPDAVREEFERIESSGHEDFRDEDFGNGQWIEAPVWSPDGTRVFGANALCVDAATREVIWYAPATIARFSPDGARVATVTDGRLYLRDTADGRIRGGPFALDGPCSLHWAPGAAGRLAVLTHGSDTAAPAVHLFDGDSRAGSAAIPHPGWPDDERWSGDRNAWAWAPDGDRAAFLTTGDTVEIWSFADPADGRRLRSLPAAGIGAVHWGADDILVLVGATDVRFVRADTAEYRGDFTFLRVPEGPRPVEDLLADDFRGDLFALDGSTWAMTLGPDDVIAPDGGEAALDSVLTRAVGRRHSWPVRWGGLRVLPDALTAADLLDTETGALLRASRDELEKQAAAVEPSPWPPPNTAGIDDLYEAARRSLAGLDADRWGFAIGPQVRAAARLRARHGAAGAATALIEEIPDVTDRAAAACDVAVILARAGLTEPARTVFGRAEDLVAEAEGKDMDADMASSFGAACHALGEPERADELFRRARGAITVDPAPWKDHLAVLHALLECGRDDLARELLADRAGHPPPGRTSEPEWLVHLVRGGRIDLAREFQSLPGWEVPYEVLTALAEAGRPDLLQEWGGHNWSVGEELIERAERSAAVGTPPVRPLTPGDGDIEELAEGYAEIRRTPHAHRHHPTELLLQRAAECGHFSAVLDLLRLLPDSGEFNDRPRAAFNGLWLALTGFNHTPW
ncbi:BRCT domain-containing protein [Streptomyces sp. NPDC058653]|uniref:BRCT domain-containing protein n=1 Tax=Streptomyces sp. NPDC058653 TaxID=3346576 RepID=UPI00364C9842